MISYDNVSKFILSDVSVHIPKALTVGIIGPSGSGKTTLMKLACGLLKADKGTVYVSEKEVLIERTDLRNETGALFTDKPVFDEEETVADNFYNIKLSYGIPDEEFTKRYAELSSALLFDAYKDERVKNLSMGQKRRAELAAVLIHEPKLLLLDEPTNGVDENGKHAFYELLKERKQRGMTIVITSHDMNEIAKLCDRIILLEGGKIIYYNDREQLLKRYAPIEKMNINTEGVLPNLDDLPVDRYVLDNKMLTLTYNSNHISAAEILTHILNQIPVKEVKIRKSGLEEVIMQIKKETGTENKYELYRSEPCK